jgi:hypothetical protein
MWEKNRVIAEKIAPNSVGAVLSGLRTPLEQPPRKRRSGEELLRSSIVEAHWSKFLSGKSYF